MIFRFFLILLTYYFSLPCPALTISADILNRELKKNYSFTERSLNQSDLKIETSAGKIFFDTSGVTVNVLSPFEENYRIEGNKFEIHDVFLDQKTTIDIDQANNFFLDILINGIDENSKDYSIDLINNATIEVISTDRSNLIRFSFVGNKLKLIRYKDPVGIEHGIELTPL